MSAGTCFLGRQPVLDRQRHIVGYELLFRSAELNEAVITNMSLASAQVISEALSGFGLLELLGRHRGFINLDAETLMSDSLELLPRDRVVLEILEHVEITGAVIDRCSDLRKRGFSLALDDHLHVPAYERLYPFIDIVKVDLLQHAPDALHRTMETFRRWPVTVLAEKVETEESFRECHALGFELFQGYFFARPVVLTTKRVNPAGSALLRLLQQLVDDADIRDIEETYRQHPGLTFNLLKLVNSVSMGLTEKIRSLRHAITMLGRRQLIRWTQLAMFARGGGGAGSEMLLEASAMRGRLMELIVLRRPARDTDCHELAFMTGVLSLIDVVFDVPMAEVLSHLNLDEDVRGALLCRGGELGTLLRIAELLERSDFDTLLPLLPEIGLGHEDLLQVQLQAIRWTHGLTEHA